MSQIETFFSTLLRSTLIGGALISAWVVLFQMAHCCFAFAKSDDVFLAANSFLSFTFFLNGKLQTDGKDDSLSYLNQKYTKSLIPD